MIGMKRLLTRSLTPTPSNPRAGLRTSLNLSPTLVSLIYLRLFCDFDRQSDAEKPEEWDDEEDGDWIAPTVRNPKCDDAAGCGEWKQYVQIDCNELLLAYILPERSLSGLTNLTPCTKANGMLP